MTFDLTTKNWQLPSTYVKTNNSPCGLWEIPNKINWVVDGGEVVLLISQAGAVGSSTFVDTAKNKVITPTNATWSNNQLLFGKPTIYINNGGLIINGPDDFNVIAGQPFCIEFYLKMVNTVTAVLTRSTTLIGGDNGAYHLYNPNYSATTLTGYYLFGGISLVSPSLSGNWNHFAISRDANGVIRGFVNGIITSSSTNMSAATSTAPLILGSTFSGSGYTVFAGNFAEIRFTKGVPVYTQNFTTPNAGFV